MALALTKPSLQQRVKAQQGSGSCVLRLIGGLFGGNTSLASSPPPNSARSDDVKTRSHRSYSNGVASSRSIPIRIVLWEIEPLTPLGQTGARATPIGMALARPNPAIATRAAARPAANSIARAGAARVKTSPGHSAGAGAVGSFAAMAIPCGAIARAADKSFLRSIT